MCVSSSCFEDSGGGAPPPRTPKRAHRSFSVNTIFRSVWGNANFHRNPPCAMSPFRPPGQVSFAAAGPCEARRGLASYPAVPVTACCYLSLWCGPFQLALGVVLCHREASGRGCVHSSEVPRSGALHSKCAPLWTARRPPGDVRSKARAFRGKRDLRGRLGERDAHVCARVPLRAHGKSLCAQVIAFVRES